jgi:hypothetical protein
MNQEGVLRVGANAVIKKTEKAALFYKIYF